MYQSHLSRSSFSTSAIRLLELMARQIRLQQPNSATFLWAMITSHSYLASFSVVSADSIASCKSFSNSRMLRSKKSFCDWMRCDSTFEQTLWLSTVDLFQVRAWPPTVFLWSDLLRRSVKRWQNYLVNTNIHFRNHAQNYATPGVCVSLTEQSKNIRTQQEARFLGDTQHEFTQGEAHCSLLDASTTNRRTTGSRISLVHVCKLLGDVMNSSLRNINGPKISKHWILSMYM